jgi:predicted ATPase
MRTILDVQVENFLSFRRSRITLGPLNVLVGPNGAGKTNFLRIFQFLGDVARQDLTPAIDAIGGFGQARFRGEVGSAGRVLIHSSRRPMIHLRGIVTEHASETAPDEYRLSFWERQQRMVGSGGVVPGPLKMLHRSETISLKRFAGRGRRITLSGGSVQISPIEPAGAGHKPEGRTVSVQAQSSGLNTLRKLGDEYGASQIESLAQVFENLRLFEVDVDSIRRPTQSTMPSHLDPNGSNVANFLEWLSVEHGAAFEKLCDDIRYVLPGFQEFRFVPIGGSNEAIRMDLKERHLSGFTPLARASYGTIRAIALFAMLHDPDPPRLTCLEEIDHGFHPHALDRVVERLRDASDRTQIIVATHSPALVNRIDAEELVIFERDHATGASRILDVDPTEIRELETESGYRLGELWFSGTLGGTLGEDS